MLKSTIMPYRIWAALMIGCCTVATAQPYINYRGVVNSASFTPPGLPGGEIGRGSVFSIFGRNIGPADLAQVSAFPLSATLAGVSIKVVQGKTSVDAFPIVVTAGQVNALMPSNAPLGKVSLRVSFNGAVSNPATITVVGSSFGIFSVNSAGFGPGILQNFVTADNQPINSLRQTAAPGQVITLWGTGLGPVSGADNVAPTAGDLPTPVEIFVGGKTAPKLYSGRTPCCSGVDQVVFKLPDDAPQGCFVPVQIRTGGATLSNAVTLAIQSGGGACSDASNPFSGLYTKGGRSGAGVLVRVTRKIDVDVPQATLDSEEFGYGTLRETSATAFFDPLFSLPPVGACTTYTAAQQPLVLFNPALAGSSGKALNGGAALSVGSGSGVPVAGSPLGGFYAGFLGTDNAGTAPSTLILNSTAGTTIQASGGADVGGFEVTPNPPSQVTWTNRDSISIVNRAQGLNIAWTAGGQSDGLILIAGANYDMPVNASRSFVCAAPVGAGAFTVPAYVLQAIPASRPGVAQSTGYLLLVPLPARGASFTASGLDQGVAIETFAIEKTVLFQ